jgi:hypothetical protein
MKTSLLAAGPAWSAPASGLKWIRLYILANWHFNASSHGHLANEPRFDGERYAQIRLHGARLLSDTMLACSKASSNKKHRGYSPTCGHCNGARDPDLIPADNVSYRLLGDERCKINAIWGHVYIAGQATHNSCIVMPMNAASYVRSSLTE